MFCKKCGQELSEGSVFCNKCGTKVEEVIDNVEIIEEFEYEAVEEVVETPTDNGNVVINNTQNDNKKKIIKIGAIVLAVVVVIMIFSSLFGGGNDYQGSYDDYETTEDNFGANNEVVTQPSTTEAITVARPDVEVVYPTIITDKSGFGAKVKILDCDIAYDDGDYQFVFTVEKICGSENKGYNCFAANIYYYDAAGNLIETKQALFIPNFDNGENGKQYKCTEDYYSKSNVELAKVEIIGG